jgi:hypothetical protein
MTTSDGYTSAGTYGFKNRIINGAMVIDQRNAGASVTAVDNGYTLDRYITRSSQASKFTVQQTSTAPSGFTNSLKVTSSAATTVGSSDFYLVGQYIEGYNIADLGWGTASAKTVTLSFQVYSSLTGTFGGVLQNNTRDRAYPFTYTISSANTWTSISITIVGDTTGTWATDNNLGIRINWGLGVGSTYTATATGAWQATGVLFGASGCVNVVSTSGATFYITGVQLEKGSTATSFDYRPYGTELQLCQRYFWRMNGVSGGNATFASAMVWGSTDVRAVLTNPVIMRAVTTVSITGTNFGYANSGSVKTLATINAADQTSQTALLYSGAGTTSATVGQAAQYVITNVDSYISVSAEL